MNVKTVEMEFKKDHEGIGFIDITRPVEHSIVDSNMQNGIATIHSVNNNVCITTMDNEKGNMSDIKDAFQRLFPEGIEGTKDMDVRPSIVGPSITVPFRDNRIILGKWQQIFMIDFNGTDRKKVVVQIMGE